MHTKEEIIKILGYKYVSLELDIDRHPSVWLLYTPEQDQYKDPNLYLWVRRCEVFTSPFKALNHLIRLGIKITRCVKHEDFRELTIITDNRGYKWYLCQAPVHDEV